MHARTSTANPSKGVDNPIKTFSFKHVRLFRWSRYSTRFVSSISVRPAWTPFWSLFWVFPARRPSVSTPYSLFKVVGYRPRPFRLLATACPVVFAIPLPDSNRPPCLPGAGWLSAFRTMCIGRTGSSRCRCPAPPRSCGDLGHQRIAYRIRCNNNTSPRPDRPYNHGRP